VREKLLSDELERQMWAEYSQWENNKPKELCKRYNLKRSTLKDYVKRIRRRLAA
jgi:hypothetical protein